MYLLYYIIITDVPNKKNKILYRITSHIFERVALFLSAQSLNAHISRFGALNLRAIADCRTYLFKFIFDIIILIYVGLFFSVAVGNDGWYVVGLAVASAGQAIQRWADDGRHQRTTVVDDCNAGAGKPVVPDTIRGACGRGWPETVSATHRAPIHRQLADGVMQRHDRRAVLGAASAGRVHRHHHYGSANLHR